MLSRKADSDPDLAACALQAVIATPDVCYPHGAIELDPNISIGCPNVKGNDVERRVEQSATVSEANTRKDMDRNFAWAKACKDATP